MGWLLNLFALDLFGFFDSPELPEYEPEPYDDLEIYDTVLEDDYHSPPDDDYRYYDDDQDSM